MNYDQYSDMPNNFFVKCTSAYDSERYLYRVLEMETYNQKGVQIVYYPVTLSATDALFGETNLQVLTRKFDSMSYYELPNEGRDVGMLGIVGNDNFKLFISIIHFDYVSTYDSFGVAGKYPSYNPKIGDIIFAKYNRQFYRVNMVKLEDDIFLQGKHTYTIFLENFRDKSYFISGELSTIVDPIQLVTGT